MKRRPVSLLSPIRPAMKMLRISPVPGSALLAAALLAGATLAAAQAPGGRNSAPACTAQTCTVQDYEAARQVTETLYGDVLTALSEHERPALRSDQNQWRGQARQHCQRQAPLRGAATAPENSAHHACMIEQYLLRRQALHHWLMNGYIVD